MTRLLGVTTLRRERGLVLAIIFFIIALATMTYVATSAFLPRGYGVLYPLDDTYIHLAISRTLAQTGTWGIAPGYPSAASSSPLWTVMLSAVVLLLPGISLASLSWLPLILNTIAAIALIVFWWTRLQDGNFATLATCILIAITPLPAIALIGMEHVIHTLFALMLAWRGSVAIESRGQISGKEIASLAFLSAAAVGARYESLALVGMITVLACIHRRFTIIPAILLPALSILSLFAALWIYNGGWAVPNALLLKTSVDVNGGVVSKLFANTQENLTRGNFHLIAFSAIIIILIFVIRRHKGPIRAFLILALSCTAAQFFAGKLGWLYRYEAWLVAFNALAIMLAAGIAATNRYLVLGIFLIVALLGAPRAINSTIRTPLAADDRAWEHFDSTIALEPLAGETVLANDIGVIAYHGTVKSIDIYGLANNDILRLKRSGLLDAPHLRALAHNERAQFGIFQLCWPPISNILPSEWRLVEVWNGPRNLVFTDRTVAFMANSDTAAKRLQSVLNKQRFRPDIWRFGENSPLVRSYNLANNRHDAARLMCENAPAIADAGRRAAVGSRP